MVYILKLSPNPKIFVSKTPSKKEIFIINFSYLKYSFVLYNVQTKIRALLVFSFPFFDNFSFSPSLLFYTFWWCIFYFCSGVFIFIQVVI